MLSANDERIFQLKSAIEAQKSKLEKIKTPTFVTHKRLVIGTMSWNLNVLQKNELIVVLSLLHSMNDAAIKHELGVPVMENHTVTEWISDFEARYNYLTQKEQHDKLAKLEEELSKRLSESTRVSMELDELAKLINL